MVIGPAFASRSTRAVQKSVRVGRDFLQFFETVSASNGFCKVTRVRVQHHVLHPRMVRAAAHAA